MAGLSGRSPLTLALRRRVHIGKIPDTRPRCGRRSEVGFAVDARRHRGSHLVREGGVEPPRPFGHTDLNRARLPIPPLAPEAGQGYPSALTRPKPAYDARRRSELTSARARCAARCGGRRGCAGATGPRRPGYHRRNPTTAGPRPTGRWSRTTQRGRDRGEDARVSGLQRFEQRLEQFVSGAFARAFRSAVQPVEISAALQRECDNNAQILSRQRRMVPNDFHVELSQRRPRPARAVRLGPGRRAHRAAARARREAELRVPRPGHDRLRGGRRPHHRPVPGPQPGARPVTSNATAHPGTPRPGAFLEVNGTRHPLQPPGLVVGRGTEADLRINDPGVSRRHIEFTSTSPPTAASRSRSTTSARPTACSSTATASPAPALQDGSEVRIGQHRR